MIKEDAYAKLNLNLHILPHKLVNGFYEVNFLNCELDLHDELVFEELKQEIKIISNIPNNLIYKAAVLIKQKVGNQFGAMITLKKHIPIKAGLGGGSADAASTIKGLIKLWKIKLNEEELSQIANKLGRDVFYSLKNGISEIKGDGSDVTKLNLSIPSIPIIIITPDVKKPSTQWMYQHLNSKLLGRHTDKISKLKNILKKGSKSQDLIFSALHNDFETNIYHQFPFMKKIEKNFKENFAKRILLAGSGLSMVGFFENEIERDKACNNLKKIYQNIICTKIR